MTDLSFEDLRGGDLVRLKLHKPAGAADIETRYVGTSEESGYHRAIFQEDGASFLWNIRQVGTKWLYGINETEYATVDALLERSGNPYIFDKHLVKLRAAKRPEVDADDYNPENRYRKPRRGRRHQQHGA